MVMFEKDSDEEGNRVKRLLLLLAFAWINKDKSEKRWLSGCGRES